MINEYLFFKALLFLLYKKQQQLIGTIETWMTG